MTGTAGIYPFPFLPEMMWLWDIMVFAAGCCIGSFLNVVIWRLPRNESVVLPPSRCPNCKHWIKWYENIPLFSWLLLRGKCSGCKSPISVRYFLVELMTGIMFSLAWFKITVVYHQPLGLAVVAFIIIILTITTAFIDAEHYIIPNKITYPTAVCGIIAAFVWPEIWNQSSRLHAAGMSLGSLVVCGGVMALLAIIGQLIFKADALGWGDVKYIAAVGALLGPRACFFTLLFGSIAGSIAGLAAMRKNSKGLKTAIPFGPFLAGATYLWLIWGDTLSQGYSNLMNNMGGHP